MRSLRPAAYGALAGILLGVAMLVGCGEEADFAVDAGESFEVTVEANPSTGYSWQVSSYPTDLLDPPRSRTTEPPEGVVGAPVEQTFTFTAREGVSGEGKVVLELFPPGESDPEETLTRTLEVSD